jgi:hypothetical protein
MSAKPPLQIDWITDDAPSKYTIPDAPTQLAGHISGTNADPKLFNWCWWRVSKWFEYLDELELNQIPDSTDYAKVDTDDLTSNRVDIDKLDQSGKTNGFIYQAGISTGKVNLAGAAGVTGVLPIGNHDARVALGLDSSGYIILAPRTDKIANAGTVTSNIVFDDNGLYGYNGSDIIYVGIDKTGTIAIGKAATGARLQYVESSGVMDIEGADLDIACTVPAVTIQAGTMTGVTVQSSSSGARSILDDQLSIYKDRGDATIAEMYRQFTNNYIVDLGNNLSSPTENTWNGIRISSYETAGAFSSWQTSGTTLSLAGKGDQLLRLQSISDVAEYGITSIGIFTKGFLVLPPSASASAPTHSAAKGTLWVTSTPELYINENASTTWGRFAKDLNTIHGSGSLEYYRLSTLYLQNGTNANTVKATLTSKWNGDTISVTDNIPKGGSSGNFSLSAAGDILTISNSGLTGSFLGGMATLFYNGVSAVNYFIETLYNASGMQIKYTASGGGVIDLALVVDVGEHKLDIFYLTNA